MDCADLDSATLQQLTMQRDDVRVIAGLAVANRRGIQSEGELANGLITGHAYSIIEFAQVGRESLVKIRNPWCLASFLFHAD